VEQPPIVREEGDEAKCSFWSQFLGDSARAVERSTAEFVVHRILCEVMVRTGLGK
jgi:hypothetical protein